MDLLVILAVALFAGILLYSVWGKGPKTPTTSAPSEQKRPRYSAPKPVPSTKLIAPTPFDERTAEPPKQARTVSGLVYVTDGDTITIQKTQVRLFGIDAPELNHPYGKAAKWALHRLCKGQRVRAEIREVDDYGRTVAQ